LARDTTGTSARGPEPFDCPWCKKSAVHPRQVIGPEGKAHVRYTCVRCHRQWDEPVEYQIDAGDVVRADLDDRTIYGFVEEVSGDRIRIQELGTHTMYWADRYQVMIY
jgi:transposase-like protein